MMRLVLCLVFALLVGCGSEEGERSAEEWRRLGDAAFAAGDGAADAEQRLRGSLPGPLGHSEAVSAWIEAANDFIFAFRMEDPVEARREMRAMLAFRAGRALSKAALHGVAHPHRDSLAKRAVGWFGEARSLEPALRAALYERAVLFESEIGSVRDLVRARDAYVRYVAEVEALATEPSEREAAFRNRAAARLGEIEKRFAGG